MMHFIVDITQSYRVSKEEAEEGRLTIVGPNQTTALVKTLT